MLFARREAEPWLVRVRVAVWPRRSWARSLRYGACRLARLEGSRHAIALGVACGVFASFQPFLGLQMLLAGLLAWMLGASLGAAMVGTFVGGPTTYPLMWLASYHLGAALTGEAQGVTAAELWSAVTGLGALASPDGADPATETLVWRVLFPTAVGALPIGLLAATAFYAIVRRVTLAVSHRR